MKQTTMEEYRERETETALLEEFGDLPKVPVNPVKDIDMSNLADLLRTVTEAKLSGKTIWSYDDPLARRLGFIVDEDDAYYHIPLSALGESDLAVWQEYADAAKMNVSEFKQTFPDEDSDLDSKVATLVALVEAENEALAEETEKALEDLQIPRPEPNTRFAPAGGRGLKQINK
jgi:hypothetical protein